jgi:hypothetical protein
MKGSAQLSYFASAAYVWQSIHFNLWSYGPFGTAFGSAGALTSLQIEYSDQSVVNYLYMA